jgi:hypothetical protein
VGVSQRVRDTIGGAEMHEAIPDEIRHIIRGRHWTYIAGQKVTLITSMARLLRVYPGWV